KLTFAENAKTGDESFARVTFLDHCGTQRMETSFAVRPEIAYAGHHQRKQRRQQLLQIVADEEVFLSRLANNSCWIDRVAAMKDRFDFKHGIIMLQGIVTVVIAE